VIIDSSDGSYSPVWNLVDEGPYLAVTLDCSFHNVCSSVFGVYSICNMEVHHSMVVTQMWKNDNKFCTCLVDAVRISEHCFKEHK